MVVTRAERWRRYGHDRLYVTGADGVRLGYRDLTTGVDRLDVSARTAEFNEAVTAWRASHENVAASPPAGNTAIAAQVEEPLPLAGGKIQPGRVVGR